MKAVILAAGEGWRLRPITSTRPKHLIPIGGKPLLDHMLSALRNAGFKEILIVVHYGSDKITKHFGNGSNFGLKIEYVHQPHVIGTADATKLSERYVEDDFLLVYGDLFISSNVINRVLDVYKRSKNLSPRPTVTMGAVPVENIENYGVMKIRGSYVIDIIEKPVPGTVESNLINAGVYVFSTEIFEAIKNTKVSPRGELEITESIRYLMRKGKPVIFAKIPRNEWLDVGNPWDFLEANRRALSSLKTEIRGKVEEGAYIHGPVYVGERARVRSGSYIEGPVFIGGGSDIGPNCHIKAHTSIGKNVRIGNACEIRNSIIMDDVEIGQLSYLGDSIVGVGCILGAGSISADSLFSPETVKMNVIGKLIDTRRSSMGVVMGDYVKTGVGSLFMPGVKIGYNSWIGPNVVVQSDVPQNTILTLKQNLMKGSQTYTKLKRKEREE